MAAGSKTRQFARATLQVAHTMGVAEEFLDRFGFLALAFRANKAFRHLLITHRIPVATKMEVLRQAFADVLSDLEFEVLQALLDRGMGIQLPGIARNLVYLAQAEGTRLDLTIFSPQAMSEQELQRLGEQVEAALERSLHVTGVTDPSLLGGIKLRLGNTLVDGTLARRLELLRVQMI
ncbi:MAG: ATP synthase F1 subunit delta [Fidelibacterota bacterium]|nr:MAG: ATP synthase F1 subunit delta [Candidatus Neomarinimicrobiota bacterium]